MKLTKEQMKEAIMRVYGLLCAGSDETDILDEMGLGAAEYENLKAAMFDAKTEVLRQTPPEHVYIQYIIDQTRNLNDLTNIIARYKDTKQPTALVGAIRGRSEILDKMIAKGQEFGVLRKAPERKEIVAGVMINDLTDSQLKKEITEALSSMNYLLGKYGNEDIINVTPGELHTGEAMPEAVLDNRKPKELVGKNTGHRGKVMAGRRVVKTKKT